MAGVVVEVRVRPGDRVTPGQEVVVLESMKMQIPVTAGQEGTVERVLVEPGQFVNEGDVLLVVA
ncbi:MAG: acetyl-CoA carboxylase biotin carboxyl carrier protein subunit [Bacillota bacterium]|nr:MAG: acetyl-CoA carboxylase biotin carboxyl carrier protein subunit [Bacillota bacterium]